MKVLVLSSSRLREPSLVERFDYYSKLLQKTVPLSYRQVKPDRILENIPKGWSVVALDERGQAVTSREFANKFNTFIRAGVTGVVFLVGDADGLTDEMKKRANWTLSLSKLTLPHQLCFVVIAEQIYRAMSILKNGKYHRD